MNRITTKFLLIGLALLAAGATGRADKLDNGNFEKDLTVTDNLTHWGDDGEAFGGARQVAAGAEEQPAVAADGKKFLRIDVPSNSWNGIWQQFDSGPGKSYAWTARLLIQGGSLPESVATFMKTEFYDEDGAFISAHEGEWHRDDTAGQWVADTMKGTTPERTEEVRYVLIAGDNSEGAPVLNRIYWDHIEAP